MNKQFNNIQTLSIWAQRLGVLFILVFFEACISNTNKDQTISTQIDSTTKPIIELSNDSIDYVVQSIVDISSKDFFKNQKPLPVAFRNVQIRYNIKSNKDILYILCGQFSTQNNPNDDEWIQFATIKNSDYEQWVGPQSITYCENSIEMAYTKTDLASELMKHIASLQSN
ncbi:MAG: hypothetical protein IPL09_08140 [Bacteroidetes bacterium]|jgi:hypothetical protein|nr:hypothetical protein [Bacteroidota bacterium]HMT35688.1 hypothetical protein [Chitinophagaceae bacterium]MBK7589396.1 hypothetical protein [Bacteroidota bacterium]MBK8329428.1 hypothetical protein [Bacteroidota bacterium]MBK9300716.1 hypothetical protein [Bacteroidota bacterium]